MWLMHQPSIFCTRRDVFSPFKAFKRRCSGAEPRLDPVEKPVSSPPRPRTMKKSKCKTSSSSEKEFVFEFQAGKHSCVLKVPLQFPAPKNISDLHGRLMLLHKIPCYIENGEKAVTSLLRAPFAYFYIYYRSGSLSYFNLWGENTHNNCAAALESLNS